MDVLEVGRNAFRQLDLPRFKLAQPVHHARVIAVVLDRRTIWTMSWTSNNNSWKLVFRRADGGVFKSEGDPADANLLERYVPHSRQERLLQQLASDRLQ